jgi:hypothetical protein
MRRTLRVQLRSHRGHWMDVRDAGGGAWAILIYRQGVAGGGPLEALRTDQPLGLPELIREAKQVIDRAIGPALPADRSGAARLHAAPPPG